MRVLPNLRVAPLLLLSAITGLLGCPAAEVAETESALQGALTALTQDRTLMEQFAKDVKQKVRPGDPSYVQAMESYGDAREAYNRYLNAAENGGSQQDRSLDNCSPKDVTDASVAFMTDATRAIDPLMNTRKIPYERGIVVPSNLQTTLHKLPRKARREIVENVNDQIRWRKWSDL